MSTDSSPSSGRAVDYALLGLLALLWGSSYLFIKVAVVEIPPVTLIAVRVTIAAAFLMLIMTWRSERLPRDSRSWRQLLVQSFFNSFGAWILLAWGQQYVDSSLATVLNSTSPIFVFFLTLAITRHEATSRIKFAGACLGLTGVVLIVGVDALAGLGQQIAGQLAILAGAMLYGCAAIYGQRLRHLSATATATGTMIWGAVILVPASLAFEAPWTLAPSMKAIGATVALSVFSTGVALLIYFRLLKTLGSLGTASQAYLRIGVGVVLGIVVLGETLSAPVAVGLLLAVLGVVAINLPPRRR